MSKKKGLTLLVATVTIGLLILIFSDVWPYLRGPAPDSSEWAWPFGWRPVSRWWAAGGAAMGLWLTAVVWFRSHLPQRAHPALWLLLLMGWHILLQVGLIYAAHPQPTTELVARAYSKQTAGYFVDSISQIEKGSVTTFLADYPTQMPHFPSEHMRTHPPGLPLLNWGAVQVMAQFPAVADWLAPTVWHGRCIDLWLIDRPPAVAAGLWLMAWMPLFIAALTLPLAYGVARALYPPEQEQTARLAAVLTGTLPTLFVFAPITDQLFAPLALLATWLLLGAGSPNASVGRVAGSLFGAGVILSGLTWLSLGNAALVLPLGLWLAWTWLGQGVAWRVWLVGGITAVVGGLSFWLIYWAGWGIPPWAIVQEGLHQHYELVTRHRRYDWWLGWNLLDLVLFSGGVWLLAVMAKENLRTSAGRLLLVTITLFLLLNLSGSTRGEVGRLWLMGMPLLLVGSAGVLIQRVAWPMGTLVAVHLALALAIGWAWQPVQPVVITAQRPTMSPLSAPQMVGQEVAEGVVLEGFVVENTAVETRLGLTWRSEQLVPRPYTVFNHLLNEDGELVAQADGWPGQGQWPPTCWAVGEPVTDWFVIDTTAVVPGTYQLFTGFYDARDGTRPREPLWLGEVVISEK